MRIWIFDSEDIIYLGILLIASVIGISRYKKLTPGFKMLTVLMPVTLIAEIMNRVLAKEIHNNLMVSHFITPAEYLLFSLTYYYALINPRVKKGILYTIPVVFVFFIINTLYIQGFWKFNTNGILVEMAALLIYSLLGFTQLILNISSKSLTSQPLFWLSTALLIFSSTMFFKFGLQNYFIAHHVNYDILENLVTYVNMLLYFLIGIALYIDKNENKSY